MAVQSEVSRSFRLYVTHVDGEGHFLKISGQLDQPSSLMIESLFETARENLEKGIGAVPPVAIHEGVICAAKYKDGAYYRAKIISTTNIATGLVSVHFIDFGNKDIISLSTIRFLDNYDPMFLQLRGQATDYYLSRIMHPSGRWEEPLLLKLQSLLCYTEYPITVEAQTRSFPLISIQYKGNDLASHLVANRFGVSLPITKQEVLLLQISGESQQLPNWSPVFASDSSSYTEHVPFLMNQNFPSNPASTMRLQNMTLPFNGSVPPPSLISQRLLVNKASRNPVNLRPPVRQPQHASSDLPNVVSTPSQIQVTVSNQPPSPKKSATYKSKLLEVNKLYKVFVSYAEEGPELFAVQLALEGHKLQTMMDEINKRPHSSLAEPPMIGTVCLGRMSGDRIICRAIVMNLSGSQCKLFFVDFGDTEMVSYYDIFDIPEEFVKPNVFAMRFCLSGVKKLEKGKHLNETFKQLVSGKVITLKVVSPEGPPLIQYGELYLDDKNVLDLLLANKKEKLQFEWMEMLSPGTTHSILVSYVDSCVKFFVQLSDMIDELNRVMDAVKVHCENSSPPGDIQVGVACCARFPDDDNWYRARIREVKGNKVVVDYVDYGNEQEVDVSDLRSITPELIRLPAQAMKCALKGFENKPVETKTSNQLEMLALEKTLMAQIVGVLSNDRMLVTLVDDTASPPLDVARKMNQLSQPRSNHEPKSTTPVRKDAPESFSSPEGSMPDESKSRPMRREKSFKEDRRPPRDNDDFGNRGGSFRSGGGSFRSRDNKDGFDRSSSGRHSEKYGGKPDRGERRPKSWENNTSPPAPVAAAEDDWDEGAAPAQPAFQPRNRENHRDGNRDNTRENRDFRDSNRDFRENNRDNRDRRKPRSDQQDRPGQRPGWKKDSTGVGKRLRQAAEAASVDAQNTHRPSIQDRLKRDNKFNQHDQQGDNDDWGGNRNRERLDRRDNRGDRRDNWGDKKENWNQKRDFRENRGDRPRSNFNPRERAERSDKYASDASDRRSEKSFRSQDSGRAPPYKARSKFTEVQYKELANPVSLDTPFEEPTVDIGAQHEVSVTWIISPESFHTQILSLQPTFLEMMHKIPELYKGVKSYTGQVSVGASVLARYPADGVLYRATIVSVQPFSKFIVRYVDFGNKQLVDAKDIWQLDSELMSLPKMAVQCSLMGVAPKDGEWKANPEIDLCFNAPRYQCVFQESVEDKFKVSLWNNGASVADMLVEKQLAVMSEHQSSVALKDEAIDLTIIVGQQILCTVTHVESVEKFYIQLDIDKAAAVENAIANFDESKLTPLTEESLAEGIHCTVRCDGAIRRAILNDVSDTANIVAVLPDYGNTVTTTLENLMILPTELSVYYYQSLECYLNNYTAESTMLLSAEELKERLTGKKFIIYINDVDGIRLVTTLYDVATGKKVDIFTPDEGAYEQVVPLCSRAVFNYNFGLAFIAHAVSLTEVYLQRASDSDKLAALLDQLYASYEEGTPQELTTFDPEGLCAAKSSDGNWYRASILCEEEAGIKVQFSDYGNSEVISKDNLKVLDSSFYEPCSLALVASLGLTALQEDAVTKLTEWTTDKEVQVTLAFGTNGWLASLHLDGVDLSIKLVNENLASLQTSEEEPKPESTVEPISLPEGCTQVYISHIDTPGHFWLQMADKVDAIDEIQADLQANADSYADIDNREMGTLCVAKYLADDQWYRAEILDSDTDITTVRFIDYGNTDVLDNQPNLIKAMPDHMKEIERYAVKSSVNAVPTGTGQWSEPASDYFTELVGDLANPVDALIVLKDITTYVDIFVNSQNLTDKLVSAGHATRSEETECGGDLPSCFASHVNSPSEFWIQLEAATPELQAMETAMVDAENFPELSEKEEGVLCAAKYPEDGAWYRAQVIVDGSEGTEVLFMDYGNASIANELRSLPEELKVKPALSRKCALQKPRDIKSWSRKSEEKFNELAAEGATIFNVQFIASGDISIVELYLEGKSVTEELVGLCEEQPVSERPTPVGQDLHSSGKICSVNSADEFYVQLDDSSADLDKVFEVLCAGADLEAVSELKVGSLCAAFWDEDEQWYRAKILEFCDGGYHVQFIDYGNKAKCEEFRSLPEIIAIIEPLAKCCRLGIDDRLSKDVVKEKLDELAAEITNTFQIEFLDSTKEPYLVKLLLNGKDVTTIITSESDTENQNTMVANECNEIELDKKESVENNDSTPLDFKTPTENIESSLLENPIEENSNAVSIDSIETPLDSKTPIENIESSLLENPVEEDSNAVSIDSSETPLDSKIPIENIESSLLENPVEEDSNAVSIVRLETPLDSKTPNENIESSLLENSIKDDFNAVSIVSSETPIDSKTPIENIESTLLENPVEDDSNAVSIVSSECIAKEIGGIQDEENTAEVNKDIEKEIGPTEPSCNEVIKTNETNEQKSVAIDSVEELQTSDALNEHEDNNEVIDGGVENELNSSQQDLDESLESNHTVVENKDFESKVEELSEDIREEFEKENPVEPLEKSDDTLTPEEEVSKDSINIDTGYTSSGDLEKSPTTATPTNAETNIKSPKKEIANNKTECPVKEPETKDVVTGEDKPKVTAE